MMPVISVSTFDTVEIKEDQKTEFKRSIFIDPETQTPGAKQMRTIAETIAAFMNAEGGMLLKHGLLCKHEAEREKLKHEDISNGDVQQRREHKCDTRYGRNLHDYASLYINPRNAMLYYVQANKPGVCLLEVDLAVLNESSFVFTNANAACGSARFFSDIADLKELNWQVVFSDRWSGKGAFYKQQMQAEFLVHPKVLPKYIKAVVCRTPDDCALVQSILPDQIEVRCDAAKYF